METLIFKPVGLHWAKKKNISVFANIQRRNTNGNVSLMTFSFFGTVTENTQLFIKETNKSHPTTKFTAEIWKNEITSLD